MNRTITITDREREVMLEALRFLTEKLSDAPAVAPTVDSKPGEQYNAGSSPSQRSSTAVTARIRKCENGSTSKGSPCVRVSWGTPPAHPGDSGSRIFWATCFDTKLFPAIKTAFANGQPLKFFVTKRGDYLNITGVAADPVRPQ